MAKRNVFVAAKGSVGVIPVATEFKWYPGFALVQNRRCIASLHEAFLKSCPKERVLEISRKSPDELGVKLSAFNLKKYVPSIGRSLPVEVVYHAGKVFGENGPFLDLYNAEPREAKRDPRLSSSGKITGFWFDGKIYPSTPTTAFYNFIYINALLENPELAEGLMEYDAFTDIVFSPQRGRCCQAEAAALYVSLARRGMLHLCRDFDSFLKVTEGKTALCA